MRGEVVFPVYVTFEDGEVESFDDVEALETNLEVFDSESATGCEVRDHLGRHVRLKINEALVLEELSPADAP
jgi:hypothetical protein